MRRFGLTGSIVLACGILVGAASGGSAAVSGSARFDAGADVEMYSVSCGAAGDCAAGGWYSRRRQPEAFVVSETDGVWGKAVNVPGAGHDSFVSSVSCAAAGNCAAGGSGRVQAFVVGETDGSWGDAITVPGTATLNAGGDAGVYTVSCTAVGECAAGGYYTDGSKHAQAFVVSETNGSWGDAIEVPGTAALNAGGQDYVSSISCVATGDCAAGGGYKDGDGNYQTFVVNETSGVWGNAVEVPGTAALNTDGVAEVDSVSCAAPGDCAAGGSFANGYVDGGYLQAFVVSETNGTWGDAIEVPGTSVHDTAAQAGVFSVSCTAVGDCTAGGVSSRAKVGAFVVTETDGSWGDPIHIRGTGRASGLGGVDRISCVTPGDCAGAGSYIDASSRYQAFVVSETDGHWGDAMEVPGTAMHNTRGDAGVESVSCAAAGQCAAVGDYSAGAYPGEFSQGFVDSETNGTWGDAVVGNLPGSCVVPDVVGRALRAAKRRLKASQCRLAKVRSAYSKVKKGRVVAQQPKPGKILKRGANVALTVSKGHSRATGLADR